jgi:ABC-type transport system involved in cytochrome bd biosynthesis fused ATPase/permease subunit
VVDADRILVFEAGRIAETGTHSELLRRRGVYWSLLQAQLRENEDPGQTEPLASAARLTP